MYVSKCEGKSVLLDDFFLIKKNYAENMKNWYLANNSQTAPTIFFIFSAWFFFIEKKIIPQNTFALSFLTYIILAIGGVTDYGRPERK